MSQAKLYPTWKEIVEFASDGPNHQKLIETDAFRAVLVGLEAGQRIAPHPGAAAVYHFLKGSGWMIADGERLAVEPGATVVVPSGAARGVEAKTQLAFLGAHAATAMGNASPKPVMRFGLMGLVGMLIMVGLMVAFALMIGTSPLAMMFSGSSGLGMWSVMALPFLGMLVMVITMFFSFRKMARGGGPPSGMMSHHMSMLQGTNQTHHPQSESREEAMSTLTYNIPAVSCGHCKMTIEREVSKLPGVSSVSVDVDAKQAVITFGAPASKIEIEALLTEIGYPPENPK